MPQIIVIADPRSHRGEGAVMLRERVNPSDFESRHFAHQLVERLGWAVEDAHEHELASDGTGLPEPSTGPSPTAELALAAASN